MPTTTEANIVNSKRVRSQIGILRYDAATPLDEATILTGWTPATPDGWTDVSGAIDVAKGIKVRHDGKSLTASLIVRQQDRRDWRALAPLAIIARHWDDIAATWDSWYTLVYGRIHGDGSQQQRRNIAQGSVQFGYRRIWQVTRIVGHKFGRPNLMREASFTGGSATLANPDLEVPLEYKSQRDGVGGAKAIDNNADTAVVSNTLANTAPSGAIGTMANPRIVRVFNGRPGSRNIGAGNAAQYFEVSAGQNTTTWGDFEGSAGTIPDLFENGPAVHDKYNSKGELVPGAGRGGGQAYRWTAKVENSGGVNRIMAYAQWNIINGSHADKPFSWTVWIKTDDALSLGRRIYITAGPTYGSPTEVRNITLTANWQKYELQFASTGNGGGAMIRIRPEDQSISSNPLKWLMDDLMLAVGYSDEKSARDGNGRYSLIMDDGIGNVRWIRPAWEGGLNGNFVIPPFKTVVFTDDEAVLKSQKDPGTAQVVQLKNVYPEMFVGVPGVGRMRGQLGGWGANGTPYDWNSSGGTVLDTIDFATVNGGVPWSDSQAILRQSPLATGNFAIENNPIIGLDIADQYGPSYWYYALADYTPTVLLADITSANGIAIPARDPDPLDRVGDVRIDTEWIGYDGIDDNGNLNVVARGKYSTTPAAHTAGASIYQRVNGAAQTGQRSDLIEIRRKPGTPVIVAGMILYSTVATPGDPGVGGSIFEDHPDWELLSRWDTNASEVISVIPPGGWVHMRHLCIVIRRMALVDGAEQRGKVNEISAREYLPGGGDGRYTSHTAGTADAVIGHVLIQHGDVPYTKYLRSFASAIPVGDLSLSEGMVDGAVESVAESALLRVWTDGLGYANVSPDPFSPYYDGRVPVFAWDRSHFWDDPQIGYSEGNKIAQVRVIARDAYSLRWYDEVYPAVPLPYGEIVMIKDVIVPNRQAARDRAKRQFYASGSLRSLRIPTGAVPFLRPWERHTVTLPGIDLGGGAENVNYYVAGYDIDIVRENWGLSWRTNIDMQELPMSAPAEPD